ncbi:MAG: long-chain fatty acid--CoA ligase [Candidatus Bathyarchaeota archaeon]|nr:long-chain fatty acid--CoA ligase [Candidatus Bathyarchaeota archaeon]
MSDGTAPWFRCWPAAVPTRLSYSSVPLQGLLEASAHRFGGKAAVVFAGETLSYSDLDSLCARFANGLCGLGIAKGDRVALNLPNIPQFIIAYFGALKAGAAVTAISPLHRQREVAYQLSDSGAKALITLDSLHPVVEEAKKKTPLQHVIVTGITEFGAQKTPAWAPPDTVPFQELLTASTRPLNMPVSPSDLAALQYTGGTTGTAKGAMLTHRNLTSNAQQFAAAIQATPDDIFLTALPLFHIYGMTTSLTVPVSVGASMVLLPKFEAAKALQAIAQHKVTVFCGVPTMYQMLLADPALPSYDLTSIRVCISGASSLPPQVQHLFMDATGGLLAEGYGLTEASPVTHCSPVARMAPLRVGSIGLPLPDTEAKIVDLETATKTLGAGEVGELAVKGPQVMLGYWNCPDETAATLQDGWLLTGDIARMDSDGYFYVVDRKKDLIKHKDYSVYPRELEDVLYEHPAVKLCAVVGKPDAATGEVPKAYIVLKAGSVVSAQELMVFVNDKVASYKTIREVEFRAELPLSAAGKVLRRQLK